MNRGITVGLLAVTATIVLVSVASAATIRGTAKAETLKGTASADTIYGGGGNDRLFGYAGNDRFYPGPGIDTVSCGPGQDVVFADAKDRVARDCETVRRPTPAPPAIIPARVVATKSGIASRLSSIGSYFSGYGIVLQNTSPDEDALDVEVLVNFLDASGLIVDSESDRYIAIPAGAVYYAGGEIISSGRPQRLEITIRVGSRQKKSIPRLPPVTNVRVESDDFGTSVLGEISNPYSKSLSSSAKITFACLDGSGNVIGGGYGYPESSVGPGGRIGFNQSIEGLSAAQIASVQVSVEPRVD